MKKEDAIIMRVMEIQDENRKNPPPAPEPAAPAQTEAEAPKQEEAPQEPKPEEAPQEAKPDEEQPENKDAPIPQIKINVVPDAQEERPSLIQPVPTDSS